MTGCIHLCYPVISNGFIIFYLCSLFQEHNQGVKQGCGAILRLYYFFCILSVRYLVSHVQILQCSSFLSTRLHINYCSQQIGLAVIMAPIWKSFYWISAKNWPSLTKFSHTNQVWSNFRAILKHLMRVQVNLFGLNPYSLYFVLMCINLTLWVFTCLFLYIRFVI